MAVSHEQIAAWDREHVIHPWSFAGPSLMIVRGEGSTYLDAEGREYLDALGGIQLCEVGHGRAELAEVAAAQMAELEYAPMFWNFGNERAAELAHRLAGLAPDGIDEVFFTNGGSESCESAIKMARLYHYLRGEPDRTFDPLAHPLLPRHDLRRALGERAFGAQDRVRRAAGWLLPPDDAVPLPRGALRGRGRVRLLPARAGGDDRAAGRRSDRGVHRRAGADGRRRDRTAEGVLARGHGALPPQRHPPDRGRGRDGVRTAGRVVRIPDVGDEARPDRDCEGTDERLPAARRGACDPRGR